MRVYYSLKSENGTRDVLHYLRFSMHLTGWTYGAYDYHLAPEITHFIGVSGIMAVEDREYTIEPGDVFLLRSNERHRILRIDTPGIIENLRFDPAFIWQGNDSFDLNYLSLFDSSHSGFDSRLSRENPALQTICDLLSQIGEEFADERYGFVHMVKMKLYMILLTLIRDFGCISEPPATLRAPNVEGIRTTMRYIDEHLEEDLTLPLLASIAGLSTNYYGTLFKQLNGITPVEYITSKRVLHAIELLPNFEGTMLELALSCGFNNTANFNRAFRAHTGQVPSKYVPPVK